MRFFHKLRLSAFCFSLRCRSENHAATRVVAHFVTPSRAGAVRRRLLFEQQPSGPGDT